MSLKILQYNVQKSKNKVMAPLLADTRIHKYDIIAIQEPWTNPFSQKTTYCPRSTPFFLVYPQEKGRCCFLVNKRLDISTWEPRFSSPDLCSLQLEVEGRKIWIHNVYSQPPGSYNTTNFPTPIPILAGLLEQAGEHIVLGDFNLHHPLWNGPQKPTVYKAAEQLLDILRPHKLRLALPQGSVTWEAKKSGRKATSTIDLVFVGPTLWNRILECQVKEDLGYRSNHFPISI
jgi:exonuclease III